jgi:hypothetical protein
MAQLFEAVLVLMESRAVTIDDARISTVSRSVATFPFGKAVDIV